MFINNSVPWVFWELVRNTEFQAQTYRVTFTRTPRRFICTFKFESSNLNVPNMIQNFLNIQQ